MGKCWESNQEIVTLKNINIYYLKDLDHLIGLISNLESYPLRTNLLCIKWNLKPTIFKSICLFTSVNLQSFPLLLLLLFICITFVIHNYLGCLFVWLVVVVGPWHRNIGNGNKWSIRRGNVFALRKLTDWLTDWVLKSIRATFNISFATHEFVFQRGLDVGQMLNMHSRFYGLQEGESNWSALQFLSIWACHHLFTLFYAMIQLKFLYWPWYLAALGWVFFVHLWMYSMIFGPECN